MSNIRLDNIQSLVNIATGQGTNQYDPFNHDTLKNDGVAFLDQNTQSYLRRQHKILRKLIETIPNQMTFRWGQITLGGEEAENDKDLKNEVEQWLTDLPMRTVYNEYRGVAAAFNQAQKAANETGNAALILMADDGQAPDAPLKKIKSVDGLFLADRWAIKPDISGLAFGVTAGIQHYILTSQNVLGGMKLVSSNGAPLGIGNVKIHKSRVLWFRGEELSDRSLQMNFGCDDSVLEGVYRSFREYDKSIRGAGRMLVDFDIYVHYIKDYLERAMADGSEAKVFEQKMQQRLQANSLSRSSWRGMVADMEEEKIETISRNVSGYGDLIDRILADFLSNTDLQPSELLQKYPDGLANTGKTEQQNSNDRTRLYQSNKFDSNIRKLLKIAFLLKGKEPEVWDWDWNELYPTTPLEQSELELNWAQIDSSRIQVGVYSPDDAAKSHYGTPEFNPNITIDFKAREKAIKDAEQQALEQAQQDPNADPNAEEQDPELVFDSADPLVPPRIVQDAAKKGMLIRRSLSSGAVPARVALLGRKLSTGDALADFERTSLSAYHQSHRKPPAVLKADAETAMYLLHGGPAGAQWVKQLSAPGFRADGMGDAPNFRDSGQRACGNCVHFEAKGRNNAGWEGCGLYGFRTSRRSLCDSYKAMYASLAPEPQASPPMELLRLENENLKMRLTLSERDDGVHPALAVGAGVAALGLIGFAASRTIGANTGKGKKCGESWISSAYECRIGSQPPNVPDHLKEFYEAASTGALVSLSQEEKEKLKPSKTVGSLLVFKKDGDHWMVDEERVRVRKVNPKITNQEALALSQYLGPAYKGMNTEFRTGNNQGFVGGEMAYSYSSTTIRALNKAAYNGINKIPPIESDYLEVLQEEAKKKEGRALSNDEKKTVLHQMTIGNKKILASLLDEFEDLYVDGKNVVMNKFLSTTFYKTGSPGINKSKVNIEFHIKPKTDGKGAGRLADPLKGHIFEAELLYPPMTQFKITGIKQRKSAKADRDIHIIEMEED
jgi:hypothetical protein